LQPLCCHLLMKPLFPNHVDNEVAGQTGSPPLEWGKRIRIARGAALGLAFLHEGTNTALVHTGIKPSNILIDQDFNGKVSR
jgi:serine/threonine protein kinase